MAGDPRPRPRSAAAGGFRGLGSLLTRYCRGPQTQEQPQTIVDCRQLVTGNDSKNAPDPAFVNRSELIDQSPRRLDETRLAGTESGVKCTLASGASERNNSQHRESLIFGDNWIGHHHARSRPPLLVANRGTQRNEDDGSSFHSVSSLQPSSGVHRTGLPAEESTRSSSSADHPSPHSSIPASAT